MKGSGTAHNSKKIIKKPVFLDIMVYVSLLLVMVVFAYMVINPGKRQSDIRNSARNVDVSKIVRAVASYVDTTGSLPEAIPLNRDCANIGNEICKTGSSDCKNYIDLTEILGETGLTQMPVDTLRTSGNGTGYYIAHDGEGNILVCAPLAERNIDITAKQFVY